MTAPETEARRARAFTILVIGLHVPLAAKYLYWLVRDLLSPSNVVATDFSVFWTGWWLVLHGQGAALYDEAAQRAAQQHVMGGMHFDGGLMAFLNPPHAALAGAPLGWLADHAGEQVALAAAVAANLLLLGWLVRIIWDLLALGSRAERWMVAALLLAFHPVLYAVSLGQISVLLAVAAVGLLRALERQRPGRAGAWLAVFSLKPQLLPPLLVLLAVRRKWAALAHAAAIGVALVAVTAAALGPSIWPSYVRSVFALERYFGTGTPAYMMNVRGLLTRLAGAGASPEAVRAAAGVAWGAALAVLALVLARRPAAGAGALRSDLALSLAAGLLFCPHLFPQDATLWAPVLALQVAALRDRGAAWKRFALFATSWPILFGVARVADLGAGHGPTLPIDPSVAAMILALAAIAAGPSAWLQGRQKA